MSYKRCFVGLKLSVPLVQSITDLPTKGLDFKQRNASDDLHITLRFLDKVGPNKLQAVTDSLSEIRSRPFFLEVDGLEILETSHGYCLCGKIESRRKITNLCTDITDKLMKIGFDFGTRPYHPHITIARLRTVNKSESYIHKYGRSFKHSWRVQDFHLFESSQNEKSLNNYNILQSYSLDR